MNLGRPDEARLAANQGRFDALIETIVVSPQFLNKRLAPPTYN